MTFGERSAWIVFVALAATGGAYVVYLVRAGDLGAGSAPVLVVVVVALIVEIAWGHVRAAIEARDAAADLAIQARDKRVRAAGESARATIVSVGAIGVGLLAATEGRWLYAHLLLLALVAGELARAGLRIVAYRRDKD